MGGHSEINLHETLPYMVFSDHDKLYEVFVEIKWGRQENGCTNIEETWKISFYNRSSSVLYPTGNP